MKIKPVPGYVLVEPEKIKETSSGLVLAKEQDNRQGVVVAVGDTLITEDGKLPCPVKVGEKVMYAQYTDELDKKRLVRFVDLMAVIDE